MTFLIDTLAIITGLFLLFGLPVVNIWLSTYRAFIEYPELYKKNHQKYLAGQVAGFALLVLLLISLPEIPLINRLLFACSLSLYGIFRSLRVIFRHYGLPTSP